MVKIEDRTIPEIIRMLRVRDWMLMGAFTLAVFSAGSYVGAVVPIHEEGALAARIQELEKEKEDALLVAGNMKQQISSLSTELDESKGALEESRDRLRCAGLSLDAAQDDLARTYEQVKLVVGTVSNHQAALNAADELRKTFLPNIEANLKAAQNFASGSRLNC